MGRTYNEDEKELLKQIGQKLKLYRKNKDLSQEQLSQKIHIKTNDISLYENGKKDISIITLNKFCNFYNINMSSLIYNIKKTKDNKINEKINTLNKLSNSFSKTAIDIIKSLEDIK